MIEVSFVFVVGVLIAGVLTFLAPCTLPLVPAFLGFISGVSVGDAENIDSGIRKRIIFNTIFYIIGFSLVFIAFGILAGLAGALLAPLRIWLTRIGGVIVIILGLYLLGIFKIKFFSAGRAAKLNTKVRKRGPAASLAFGAAFGAGWSPCIGPIVGSVLLLTSTQGTVGVGALLLGVFSIGLGIPFLLTAFFLGQAIRFIERIQKYLDWFNRVAGVIVIALGLLLITNNLDLLIQWGFRALEFLNYEERLLNFL